MTDSRTIRWLVVACLALSLVLSGVGSSLTVPAVESPSVADAPQHCCCGTADGRCCGMCGMACCVSQTPTAPEKPVRLPTRDDYRPNLLALARIEASVLALGRSSFAVRPPTNADCAPAESSLQAFHVRLDV
ncbi:MAG TPA: hypothetical protein VMM76_09955 [Pirellulaceae bacterium]|nr:hypothetical protein [Pirellulaceae bacterium]